MPMFSVCTDAHVLEVGGNGLLGRHERLAHADPSPLVGRIPVYRAP
jgi:hypothetical protein